MAQQPGSLALNNCIGDCHRRRHKGLTRLRTAIFFTSVGLALFCFSFDLAWLEPFDGWVLKWAAPISATIALLGLVASLFVPQAYCRYGCPTGELLKFVKSGDRHDRLGSRNWAAGGLVLIAATAIFLPAVLRRPSETLGSTAKADTIQFGGPAFGTTWSAKVRGSHDAAALKSAVAAELERVESTLSHWRPDSFTSQFNASETTLATEHPAELIALAARAEELSQLTGGAYDITVAPLVDAWGFGPSGPKTAAPSDEQIQELLERTGWQKLIVDRQASTLRKLHPRLQIDLGSLLQGHAADCVARVLDEANVREYLVEVGGELFARGPWQVAIEDPRDPNRPLTTIMLADSGLATSGFYRATRQLGAATAHHLISPRSGRPIEATATLASVSAPTAAEADAWATALLAVGLPEGLDLAERRGLACCGWIAAGKSKRQRAA